MEKVVRMQDPVQERDLAGMEEVEEVEQVLDIARVEFSEKVSGKLISAFPSRKVRGLASTSGIHNNSTAVARTERTGRISGKHTTAALLISIISLH